MKKYGPLFIFLSIISNSFAQFSNVKDTVFVTIPFNSSQTFSDTLFNFGNIAIPLQWNVSANSTIAPGHSGLSICGYPGGCYPFDNAVHSTVVNTSTALLFLLSWQVDATALIGSKSYVVINTNIDGGRDIVWEITVEDATAFSEESNEALIKFYPIPASDIMNLETTPSNSTQVELVNIFGAVVKRMDIKKNSTTQIDLNTLPSGPYFIHVINADHHIVARNRFVKY